MSSEEVLHCINNQLTVLIYRAELLGATAEHPAHLENCREIQAATRKISSLVRLLSGNGVPSN
jgi:hypothetical protein